MTSSSLNPENINRPDRQLGKGHGTAALGPSDTSDSGSDIVGGEGLAQQDDAIRLDTGTTSEREKSTARHTAGPDVGDANLDSDTSSTGTGERATAGRDTVVSAGQDIDADHIEQINGDAELDIDVDNNADSTGYQPSLEQSKKGAGQRQDVRR
jgi:hypothetical protein